MCFKKINYFTPCNHRKYHKMKAPIFLTITLFIAITTSAHPGIGIVKDSKGFIYYTDLANIYRIDPATQQTTIVVHNVHSHEISIDKDDNLYGEHLWYVGGGDNRFDHYLWRLNAVGKLDTLIAPTRAYVQYDFSLCRDTNGNEYWVQAYTTDRILKKTKDGKVITIAQGSFKDVAWLKAIAGNVYYTQNNNLYKINEQDSLVTVVSGISSKDDPSERGLYGIWQYNTNDIYLADFKNRMVKKINPAGKIDTIFFEQESDWSPTGGLFDNDGNLWVMEYSKKNEVRVMKAGKESIIKQGSKWLSRLKQYWAEWVITAILFIGATALLIYRGRKKK